MNVVAHSMGRLVSRYAVLNNSKDGNRCIKHFVTISPRLDPLEFGGDPDG